MSASSSSSSSSSSKAQGAKPNLMELAAAKKLQEGTMEERRQVREQYRLLRKNVEQHREDLVDPRTTALKEMVYQLNGNWLTVTNTREAHEDYHILNELTSMGVSQVKHLAKDKSVSPGELIRRVQGRFRMGRVVKSAPLQEESDGEDEGSSGLHARAVEVDFAAIGRVSFGLVRNAPVCGFMNGSILAEKKVIKKSARQRVLTESVAVVVGKEIDHSKIDTVDRVTLNVQHMYAQMPDRISLYEGFFDADSFSRTVENVFDLSFLMKDGRASLEFDKNDIPIVCKTREPTKEDLDSGLKQMHHIFRLDMRDFHHICEAYDLGAPQISRLTEADYQRLTQRKK